MLKRALIFVLVVAVAGPFGFTGVAAGTDGLAKTLLVFFLVLFVVVALLALLGIGTRPVSR